MKIIHSVCIKRTGKPSELHEDVQLAMGTDRVTQIINCDPRTFGEKIQWHDGVVREITRENVADYFIGQGHELIKVVGNRAFGNTIIEVDAADSATSRAKIDAHIILTGQAA